MQLGIPFGAKIFDQVYSCVKKFIGPYYELTSSRSSKGLSVRPLYYHFKILALIEPGSKIALTSIRRKKR